MVRWSSVSQRPGSDHVHFPGAVNAKFTSTMKFSNPAEETAMPVYRVMDADGKIVDDSRSPPDITNEDLVKMYMDMLTVSIMDLIMFDAQRQGRLSFYMVSAGEEGIAVGSASALTMDDVIFAQYREAGVLQYRGFTLDEFMSQLFANAKDPGRGRNMPIHYGSRKLKLHTISSPLATQIPQAAGAAYALKLQHNLNPSTTPPAIVACYFGEGAASEGDFHAGLNLAATRACPVVFVCRNNGYAISTPTLEQYRGDGIASRGTGYGIPTIRVDGNDVLAMRVAMTEARRLALGNPTSGDVEVEGGDSGTQRGQCTPVLVEAMSYRVSHHSTSDDSFAYRARVEVDEWKRRDNPLIRLRKFMERRRGSDDDTSSPLWDEEKEKSARSSIRAAVLLAFQRAEREKRPPLRSMFEDVYAEVTPEAREHAEAMADMLRRYPDEYDCEEFEEGVAGMKLK